MFSTSSLLASLLSLSSSTLVQAHPHSPNTTDPLTVTTPSGTYIGLINGTAPQVRQFLSIPFAEPPVGNLRFAPPVQCNATAGPRDTTQFPPSCPQYNSGSPSLWSALVPEWLIRDPGQNSTAGAYATGSAEDCLYLGIWTPTKPKGKLPVLVFLTGGGFQVGGVDIPYQLPYHWVQRTQAHIVVSVKYVHRSRVQA